MSDSIYVIRCADGKHIGVNNTTGKCPACGEQLEGPSNTGFSKAVWMQDSKEKCMYDNFKPSDGPLWLVCTCPKCSVR